MRASWIIAVAAWLPACAASPAPDAPRETSAAPAPSGQPSGGSSPRGRGRLAPKEIQRIIRQAFGRLRACYERDLARDPEATGRTVNRFAIGPDGRVQEVTTTMDGTLGPGVGPCLEGVFGSLVFPAPEGGIVTVTYPIIFSPVPPSDPPP